MSTKQRAKETSKSGYWLLKVSRGCASDYHVSASCSKCGWQWESIQDGVGNPKYVFSAFLDGGSGQDREDFVLRNARERKLYGWCPQCGAQMEGNR